ncbi:MAG: STAS domain-containing protein [Alphaproteobacteria bacterium]|nr:STAS domain-containing protein [Alphaproteobacteria bacterium]
MAFKFRREGNDLVVYITGALTFHQHTEGEQLVYQITSLVDKGEVTMVRLNFAEVTRMDSHWLGVLIRILRRVREKDANFVIEKPGPNINRLFEMVELNRIAEIRI